MKVSAIVHPNSKNQRIEEDLIKMLHVYVNAPPLEGKANKTTIEVLANHFGTKKGKVILVRGENREIRYLK